MVVEWVIRAVGVFWFVGGIATIRAAAQSRTLDAMLAAFAAGWTGRERARAALLAVGAVLTTLSGAALIGLDRAAPGLMVANGLVQGAWLLFAARAFPPEDEGDRVGRRRVVNAFLLWVVVTGLVIGADLRGDVVFTMQPAFEIAGGVAALVVLAVQARAIVFGIAGRANVGTAADDAAAAVAEEASAEDAAEIRVRDPRRWMLAPDMYGALLVDLDADERYAVADVDLPEDLAAALGAFEDAVVGALVPDDGVEAGWALPAAEIPALEARAEALAEALGSHSIGGRATWHLPAAAATEPASSAQ